MSQKRRAVKDSTNSQPENAPMQGRPPLGLKPEILCFICCQTGTEMTHCIAEHQFCTNCLLHQARVSIKEGKAELTCLWAKCDQIVGRNELRRVLPEWMIDTLDKRVVHHTVANLKNYFVCECGNVVELIDPVEEDRVFHCECGRKTCRVCKFPWDENHHGTPCEKMGLKEDKENYEEQMASAGIRCCPKCSARVIKEEKTCNKISCPCKAIFCYLCEGQIFGGDDGYGHFCTCSRPQDGKPCTLCNKKCMLWEDPQRRDKAKLEQLQKEREEKILKRKL